MESHMPRITKAQFKLICEELANGKALTRICKEHEGLPHYRTVLRHVQDTDEAYQEYRKARSLQAEIMRDDIIALVEQPLPIDSKAAMAEVGRRRLEVEQKDKYIRQLQPSGIRDKVEDNKQASGTITLSWGGAEE
tara:strand:- start:176 stop:583 length:408 start_codon:yes stop_codon:yes gene_type:complete